MCLLIALFHVHPEHPLVIAANRDEMLARPTTAMMVLRESPKTIGGRDEQAGGTWLAVNEHGVVAGLTNLQGAAGQLAGRRSRGELPLTATRAATAEAAVRELAASCRPDDYNGAWMLVGDRVSLWALDLTGEQLALTELRAGVHVLENRALDEHSPKVDHVRTMLAGIERARSDELPAALAKVLADHTVPAAARTEPELSRRPSHGAAACVHGDGYGTRWAAVVRIAADPQVRPRMDYAAGSPCLTELSAARW
jgi:uncharacterized protein with NRDE domain